MSWDLNLTLGPGLLDAWAWGARPPQGPLPCPSLAPWPQSRPRVPPLLPPDFPSWPVSRAGPMPSPGPAPWHSARLGTCSWNPAILPLCSSREQGAGPGPGGPRVRPGNAGWGLVPPPTHNQEREKPTSEEPATQKQRRGESREIRYTLRAALGPLSSDTELGYWGCCKKRRGSRGALIVSGQGPFLAP